MAGAGTERVAVDEARQEIARGDAVAVDVRSGKSGARATSPARSTFPMPMRTQALSAPSPAVAVDGDMGDWTSENFPIQPASDPDEDTALGLK